MKNCITICYTDDILDPYINRYLDEFCNDCNKENLYNYHLEFLEYSFEKTDNYKTLLTNDLINRANILVIDSWLFENENSSLSKFTGEQFKIILRQVLPFIKTIVISQNSLASDTLTLQKFQSARSINVGDYKKHYDEILAPTLKQNILACIEEYKILNQLTIDNEVDSILVDTIQTTILGIQDAALFEKDDLDELIKLFNEVKLNYVD